MKKIWNKRNSKNISRNKTKCKNNKTLLNRHINNQMHRIWKYRIFRKILLFQLQHHRMNTEKKCRMSVWTVSSNESKISYEITKYFIIRIIIKTKWVSLSSVSLQISQLSICRLPFRISCSKWPFTILLSLLIRIIWTCLWWEMVLLAKFFTLNSNREKCRSKVFLMIIVACKKGKIVSRKKEFLKVPRNLVIRSLNSVCTNCSLFCKSVPL